ncbi:hypothetical protein RB195_000329 [Necator americanus]|uniref:Uncharacterized protein n=1 Tax=Necator americanus TaxID=51031 RepID=A0ABR1D936_NECAM
MLLGLIVGRTDTSFRVYCSHGDFDLKISECDADYEIGKWIGLALRDGEVLDHGIAFLPDLPPVRVRNGMVEVLTVGTIISWSNRKISLCDTPDFGAIPILDQLPNNAERSYQNQKFQIWARRLNEEECECFGGHKWGVSQFVDDAPPHNDNVEIPSEPQVYCDDRDIDGKTDHEENIHLQGLITSSPVSQYGDNPTAYIWSRLGRNGLEGLLHYSSDPRELSDFNVGQWIDFWLDPDYVQSIFDRGTRTIDICTLQCKPINGPYLTRLRGNSVELNVPLSVTLAHRQGDDFYHEELGAIRDERRLLQSGQDYEATVVRIRPRPSTVENEMAMWKVLSAVPIGEKPGHFANRKKMR